MELLLGCGNRREKVLWANEKRQWDHLVTLDRDPDCGANIIWDLEDKPWPVESNQFDEVHAYEILEHLGTQGDFRAFFDDFSEIHRTLKSGGLLFATCPAHGSVWLWGDPSHRRAISRESLTFLSQEEYRRQVGVTGMTDFRWYWKGDFELLFHNSTADTFAFCMRAIK